MDAQYFIAASIFAFFAPKLLSLCVFPLGDVAALQREAGNRIKVGLHVRLWSLRGRLLWPKAG